MPTKKTNNPVNETNAELVKEIERLKETNKALFTLSSQNISHTGNLLKAYAKYNAKLRRMEQEEAKFFQWNCIILCCASLLLSILMWWCE